MSKPVPASARVVPHIVGVVGLAGSGKSTVADVLRQFYGYKRVYFGGHVLEEVRRRTLPPGESSEHEVREDLRRQHGMAAMAILSEQEIRHVLDQGSSVVIDGLYSLAELTFLRERFSVVVVAIHAPAEARRRRIADRADRPLTASQLHERDIAEIRGLDKAPPIALADYHIISDGSAADLVESVGRVVAQVRTELRDGTWETGAS